MQNSEFKLKTDKMECSETHVHVNMEMNTCSSSYATLCEHRQICKCSILVMMLSSH